MSVVELSGGVGGARLARGLAALADVESTVVVNVGDDETVHGLHVSPDLDTVVYTLAGVEGSEGWGRAGDTFTANSELARFGVDNRFRLGDLDLALNLYRTSRLSAGVPLSVVTTEVAEAFGVAVRILPATDDPLRTEVRLDDGWTSFQDYFVIRGNRDEVRQLRYRGAAEASPAPGVLEAIVGSDLVMIAPSNPPLSVWPILAVGPIREAVAAHPKVCVISPLFGGRALKGPADRVMASLDLPPGNLGIAEAYRGLVDTIVIDEQDAADAQEIADLSVMVTDTRIPDAAAARRLAEEVLAR
jgi:LPPG:FO 2-phospho-L-lactate transferase